MHDSRHIYDIRDVPNRRHTEICKSFDYRVRNWLANVTQKRTKRYRLTGSLVLERVQLAIRSGNEDWKWVVSCHDNSIRRMEGFVSQCKLAASMSTAIGLEWKWALLFTQISPLGLSSLDSGICGRPDQS